MPPDATTPVSDAPAATTPAPTGGTAASQPTSFSWDAVTLSPEMKQLVSDRQWKDVDSALTSYRNLEKLTGVPPDQIIKLPKDNDKAAWDSVYNRLGRPETPDKYALPLPEGDKGEFANVAKTWFHEAGVSQGAATKLAEKWNGYVTEAMKAEQAKVAEQQQISINELKQAWGGDYDKRAQVVDRAAETFGMNQDQLSALKQVLGPKGAMEFLYNVGSKVAIEDKTPVGMNGQGPMGAMTQEQAQAKLAQLRADKTFASMFVSKDPKQQMEAREQIDRLAKLAYPGSTVRT